MANSKRTETNTPLFRAGGMARKGAGFSPSSSGTFGAPTSTTIAQAPLFYDYRWSTPDKFYYPRDRATANAIWRDIYRRDATISIATDMYAELPWGPFDLEGIDDSSIRKFYEDMFNSLNLVPKLPVFTRDFLITGEFIPHLIFNSRKGYWERVISHNPDYVKVQGMGLAVDQPLLWLKPTPNMRMLVQSDDPRVRRYVSTLPAQLVSAIRANKEIPLDSLNTTYVPRMSTSYDERGTSLYTRIYRFNMYEDFVVNSSLAVSQRNAAPIRMFKLGAPDGTWSPTQSDIDAFYEQLSLAESDPLSVLITHKNIEVEYVGVSDKAMLISREWDFIERAKLLAMGVSKAFLLGDSSFACFEKGTPVLMSDGAPKPIEDVKNGDLVLDQFGKAQKVTNNWCEGVPDKLLEITTWGGRKFRVTHNHKFPVRRQHENMIVVAGEFQTSDFLKIHKTQALGIYNNPDIQSDSEYTYVPIKETKEVDNVNPVYNLEVDSTHTYLICDGIATCNSAIAGLQTLLERLASYRHLFEDQWIVPKVCRTVAEMHGFFKKPKSELEHRVKIVKKEDRVLIVPKIKWRKNLEAAEESTRLGVWKELQMRGIISERTLLTGAGADIEVERRNKVEEEEFKRGIAREYGEDFGQPKPGPGQGPIPFGGSKTASAVNPYRMIKINTEE